jgi:hypothetical protein
MHEGPEHGCGMQELFGRVRLAKGRYLPNEHLRHFAGYSTVARMRTRLSTPVTSGRLTCRLSFVAATSISLAVAPADGRAQNPEALFLGIIGAAIQDAQRQQHQQQRQQQERSAERARQDAERRAETARVRRAQSALAEMGFYSMAIDGSAGPGTRAAVRSYMTAFAISRFDFTEQEVIQLERHAGLGFPDIQTERQALSSGFRNNLEYSAAARAGFARAADWREAQRLGVATSADLAAFRSSGFTNLAAYRSAQSRGFSTAIEERAARAAGFERGNDYRDFVASGVSSRQEFEELRAARARASRARASCLSGLEVAPEARFLDCAEAVTADRNDRAASARLESAGARLAEGSLAPLRLAQIEAVVDCILGPPRILEDRRAEACQLASAAMQEPGNADLLSDSQRSRITEELNRAEAERHALAAATAREEGARIFADIADFLAAGRRFERAVEVARATTALQAALGGRDNRALIQSVELLVGLAATDTGFVAFRAERIDAEQRANARMLERARSDLERYVGFIEDFLVSNMLDTRAAELLTLSDRARDSLASENSDQLVRARAGLADRLRSLRLLEAAEAFRPTDDAEAARRRELVAEESASRRADDAVQQQALRIVEDIEAYVALGQRLADPVAVARAVALLRDGLAAERDITGLQAAIDDLSARDEGLTRFRAERERLRWQLRSEAMTAARREAETIVDFIFALIEENPLRPEAPALLGFDENLRAALDRGDPDMIAATGQATREQLVGFGFAEALDAFITRRDMEESAEAVMRDRGAQEAARQSTATSREQGERLLEDVAAFVEAGGRFDDPLGFARALSALRNALASDADAAQALEAMLAVTERNEPFGALRSRRAAERSAQSVDTLAIARSRAQRLEAFVVALVARDPLRRDLDDLLAVSGSVSDALQSGDPVVIEAANAAGGRRLRALGLQESFESFLRAEDIGREAEGLRTASNGLSLNPVNAALLEGDAGDILILANRRDAPSLHRTLLGEDAFRPDRAGRLCWAHEPPSWSFGLGLAMGEMRALGGDPVLPLPRCDEAPSDMVLVLRQAFLALPADRALPVVRRFEDGALEVWSRILAADVDARLRAERAEAARLASTITAGLHQGWALVVLDGQGTNLCIGPEGLLDPRTPALMVAALQDEVSLRLPFLRRSEEHDADRLFLRATRGGCAGIWASGATLAAVLPALERETVVHQLTAVHVGAAELADMDARVARADAERDEDLAALRQQLERDWTIALETARRDRLARNALQEELRAIHSAEARAILDRFSALIAHRLDDALVSPRSKAPDGLDFADLFPGAEGWLAEQGRDFWQIESHRVELLDYGTATWSDRRLETALVKLEIEVFNRLRGERTSHCVVLGLLFDDEFGRLRDPVETTCDPGGEGQAWLQGIGFDSRWTIAQ